jgi:hypothetical protein
MLVIVTNAFVTFIQQPTGHGVTLDWSHATNYVAPQQASEPRRSISKTISSLEFVRRDHSPGRRLRSGVDCTCEGMLVDGVCRTRVPDEFCAVFILQPNNFFSSQSSTVKKTAKAVKETTDLPFYFLVFDVAW